MEQKSAELVGSEGAAVEVRGAYKRHGANAVILRGLDMTVKVGNIYGLLGPSGCGKTTLLRSIVGISQLDHGSIYVKAHWRNMVGYMPQDIGLYDYMSISEAFSFYGKLFGMKKGDVREKGAELVDFLELPKGNRLIRTMSGGQQRRLSFAVTLLHDPELLILDEPTVGVDPVLCAAIWDRLVEMASKGKTIIITTHYIEETKQAHAIGLMRDGVLLAEQSPQALMAAHKCNSLEEAFLRLSQRQEADKKAEEEEKQKPEKVYLCCKKTVDDGYPKSEKRCLCIDKRKQKPTVVDPSPCWNTRRFCAQLAKNGRFIYRNFQSTLFTLLLPACIVLLCQLVLGKNIGANKRIGIVSPELTKGKSSCHKKIVINDCAKTYDMKLTCAMIHHMEKEKIETMIYKSLREAKKATLRNTVWGVLVFHPNYTDVIHARMKLGLGMYALNSTLVEDSYIKAYMDMSNMWISTYLRRVVTEVVRVVLRQVLKVCKEEVSFKAGEKVLDNPLSEKVIVFGDSEPPFLEFFIPGVVCTFAFYLSIMYTTGAIMFERSVGLERSLVAGMTKLEVIMAHIVVQVLMAVLQQLIVLILFYAIFTHTMVGSIFLIVFLLILLQIMGLFYGLVLGLFFDRESDATNAGVGTINTLFMLAGVMWPVEGMNKYLKMVIPYFPVQPAVESYRAIAMRAWKITHHTVYYGFLSTGVWTCVFVLLTVLLVRSRKDSL